MTHKLTKNDRINDCHLPSKIIYQKKKINLRNVTKAFEMVLAKHNARECFLSNWAEQSLLFSEESSFKLWKKTRKYYNCGNWIARSFVWSRTKEGYLFWKKVNTDWENWVNQHVIGPNESRNNTTC